jgi:hypothetical protein
VAACGLHIPGRLWPRKPLMMWARLYSLMQAGDSDRPAVWVACCFKQCSPQP